MYIDRDISVKVKKLAKKFPVVFLTGPRQSGKSTLLKRVFHDYPYVNLEEIDVRNTAIEDPRGFLDSLGERAIIDEAQRAPNLFSYIQTIVDNENKPGRYILSGSQNFLMLNSISQSLAGRTAVLSLLPFSRKELAAAKRAPDDMQRWLYQGGYPRIFSSRIAPEDYFPAYIQTYVERDIRSEIKVHDVSRFSAFLKTCAARVGSPINFSDIGRHTSADARTIASWLSMLEESYIVFRLEPWYKNFGKRQTKTPKLYFHDTGLLCALLDIRSAGNLTGHPMRGHIFENAVISELSKRYYNDGQRPPFYFWRDPNDQEREVDLLIEQAGAIETIEIKSSQTANRKYAANMRMLEENAGVRVSAKSVIYDGPDNLRVSETRFTNWRMI